MSKIIKSLKVFIIPVALGVAVATNGAVSAKAFDAKSFFEQQDKVAR